MCYLCERERVMGVQMCQHAVVAGEMGVHTACFACLLYSRQLIGHASPRVRSIPFDPPGRNGILLGGGRGYSSRITTVQYLIACVGFKTFDHGSPGPWGARSDAVIPHIAGATCTYCTCLAYGEPLLPYFLPKKSRLKTLWFSCLS